MADTWGESDKPVKAASNQGEAWGEGDSAVPASALRKVGDLGLSVAKGVVAVPEALVGLADIPTGGRVGKFLENEGGAFGFRPKQAKEYLGGLQSDDLRDKQQQFQKADGIIDKAGVALSNPSLITNAVAESVPLMGAGIAPARAALAVAPKLGAVAAGAIGEGVVGAGSAAEGIRQETADGLMTAGQSGLALASGAATSVFGFAGGKLAQRLGIGDVDTMLTQGAIKTAGAPSAKSIPRQVVEGAIAEGWLEELPQSVSEQVLHNLALDKPWYEGVSDAAVMGTLAGMAMGGGAAGVSGFAQDAPPADAQQPPAAPPAPPQPQAGPTLALPAPDPGVIAVGGDGTARTPAYQKPSFAGDYADVTDVVPRALAPQPADPVRAAVESAANAGGAISPAALVAIDSGVTPRQESAFEDVPELGAQPPQVNLDDLADPYDRAYYESLFDDDPAPLGAPPVLSAFLQNDDDIPDFDAANNVSEEDFLRALGADEQEIQDAIATTPNRAESAPEGAALPAGPQANVTAGAPEGAGAGAEQPAGPVADAPTNLRDALAKVRAQKQEAANAQAAQAPASAAAPAPGPTGAPAVEANGVAPQASIQAITAKQIPDMTDAELQAAIVHYGPAHKRTAKLQKEAQRRAAPPPQSQPNGAPNVPQADQAQQAAAPPAQAGPAQPAQGLTDAAAAQNHGAQGTPAPGAQAQTSDAAPSDKAKWIKAAVDKSRLNGGSGVQLTVTPQGEVTFSGDPRSTKEGKALLATYEEALRAGATKKEIADALMAARGQAAARPDVTLTNEGDTTPAAAEDSNANQAQTTSQQAQVATESGAPEETREQRAQRVAEAGESWTRMPTVEREALAARADGLNPIQRKRVPSAAWTSLNASIQRRLADAMGARAETGGNQTPAGTQQAQAATENVASQTLDEQLKQVNDQLANQGAVQNANTRAKRDQIRKAIAERDFPAILKAVEGDIGSAEAINQALQFAGDEPKAKVIERVLKNRGISAEYRQRWAERLMDGQVDELDAEMQSYENKADVERRPNLKKGPSSARTPVAPPAPQPSGTPSAQARWDVFMPQERLELLRAAGYTDADQARALSGLNWVQLSEAVRKAVDAAHKKQVAAAGVDDAQQATVSLRGKAAGDMLEMGNGTLYRIAGIDIAANRIRLVRNPDQLNERTVLVAQDDYNKLLADHEQTMSEAAAKPAAPAQDTGAALQAAMQAAGWTAEVAGADNTIWIKTANKDRYTALWTPGVVSMEVTVLVDGVDTQIASFKVGDAKAAAGAANKAVADDVAQSAPAPSAGAKPAPAKKPAAKKPNADQTRAKADLMNALADLGDILGKNTRMNIVPEQEQKLLPVLTRVLDAAFRLGYHKFKDSAKFALDQIRTHLGDDAADALTLDHLQGAYIAMAGGKQGADTKRAVIDVESKAEIEQHEAAVAEEQATVDNTEATGAESTQPGAEPGAPEKETQDAGTAIHRDGVAPLEPVASQDDAGAARGGDAGPRGADGQQGRGAAGGQPDADGDATTRSGGNGPAGRDPVQAGAGDTGRPRKPGQVSRPARKRGAKATPAELQAEASEEIKQASPANVPGIDFTITDEVELGKGTEGVKFADNLAAIRTLKTIEQENRRATPEEQRILARYVGWGGLKNAFRVAGAPREGSQGIAKGWESRVAQVEELLTPAELRAARNSTTAAHYTSQAVVQAVWKAVQRLGYRGGAVLEPSVGTGNFLGLMPAQLRGASKVFAVEYDSLTARIAQHLYPNQTIVHAGLQDVPLPEGKFALAIGNPPFGKESLYFRHNPALQGKSIHNQFFLQSLHSLAEDGVMGMVVSHNLMDAQDQTARMAMAIDAEFLGGIRLPDTAFKENARTDVVTDMLYFRKRSANEREFAGLAATKIRTGKLDAKTITDFIGTEKPSAEEISTVRQRAEAIEREMLRWVPSSRQENFAGSGETISVNPYFLQNPRLVVGTMNATGTMNARADLNVTLDDPATMAQRLDAAIEALPQRAPVDAVAERTMAQFDQMAEAMRLAVNRAEPGAVRQAPDGRLLVVVEMDDVDTSNRKALLSEIELTADTPFSEEFSLRSDGKWLREENKLDDAGNPIKRLKKDGKPSNLNEKVITAYDTLASIPERDKWGQERIALVRDMLPLRDAFKRQMVLEASDAPAGMMEDNRARLNKLYQAFTAKHGSLHKRATGKVAMTMPDGALVLALEDVGKDGGTKPAAILSRRVTIPPKPVERVQDAGEAVAVVLAERGGIDLDRVAKLLGTDAKGAEAALSAGDSPRAFFDPETNQWEPADGYLSGMVRRKLLAAKAAGLEANVAALEKVQPEPWDSSQVTPTMGSNWIPEAVYADFLKHLGFSKGIVLYSPVTNTFTVDAKGQTKAEWATSERGLPTDEIVQRMLNSKPMRVMVPDGDGNLVFDEEGTTETQMKAREIGNEFMEWAFADDDRREDLVQRFNEKFNTRVVRQRDGSHLTLPGKVPDSIIKMRPWQLNAIWRGITDNAVLYDHAVGAGKTFTAIARAMERRRMGMSKKPMIVVPNHLVEQWAADARKLYPGANILAATKDDFEKQRRRRLFARIGAGDYDMVIVGHSSFSFIDIDPATEERYLDEELRIAYAAVKEAEEAAAEAGFSGFGKPMGVAQAEQLVKRLEERMAKVRDNTRDRLLTFEQMGVDDLTVDEAHEFKNLAYTSNLQGVAGMGNKTGSGKAMDLNLKIRSLKERPGTSVAFLTGTPISNSVAEMYLVLRNLVPKELADLGMENFDAWRINYVTAADAYEPTESGSLKEVTRLGREWSNMRSLMELYYTVADAVTLQDMKDDYAKANPGKSFPVPRVRSQLSDEPRDREMVAIKPTEQQREILRDIVSGFNGLPDIKDRKERNIARLQLMDRARKVSLDARAVDPRIPVPKGTGKIGAVVDRAFQIYEKTAEDRGTQLIFLDRSVPKARGDDAVLKAFDKLVAELGRARDAGDAREVADIEEKLQAYNISEINELRAAQAGGWNAYQEIKDQLVAKGVPAGEIRFVQEANTDLQKAALFKQVNNGEVRILIGSTPRMGAGTNVQERLVALHHVDVTWKPSDIEQREGRIVRQQNLLLEKYGPEFTVDVIAYATEMTVDAKMWSLNATKLKAINGVRKYDGAFNMEFDDEESAGMAEMAALATGNPLMVERVVLDGDIKKLEMAQRSFNRRVSGIKSQLRKAEMFIEHGPATAKRLLRFAEELDGQLNAVRERSAKRRVTVDGKEYTNDAEALLAATKSIDEQHKNAGNDKARYVVDINGESATSRDRINALIAQSVGDKDFEMEVNGKTIIDLSGAVRAIMDLHGDASTRGREFTIPGLKINGMRVDLDVSPSRWRKDASLLSLVLMDRDGVAMYAREHEFDSPVLSGASVRAGLTKMLAADFNPGRYSEWADDQDRNVARSKRDLPDLKEQAAKIFPREAELKEKRARLAEVITLLQGTSDAARLDNDAPRVTDNGEARIMSAADMRAEYGIEPNFKDGVVVLTPGGFHYANTPSGTFPTRFAAQKWIREQSGQPINEKQTGSPEGIIDDVVFSRAPAAAPSRADSNARNVATQLLVDGLKAKWTRAPEIIVARNMQDGQIPQAVRDYDETLKSQGATGEARGFIYKGKVYLLSDQLKGPEQIAEVLFHEVLGHYGLRGAFGDSLNSILQQMSTMRRKEVVAKAREYGLFDSDALGGLDKKAASDAQIWAAMSPKDRLSAAEEVLAEMAQTQPNIGFVQRAIAAIRNWLRAHVPGFERMRLTDADIVQAYILPARGYVTRSNETAQQAIDRAMLAFSRAYHGTPHRGIEKFSTDKIGTGEGAQAYGWGLYFASRRGIAERYRKALQTVTRGGLLYKGKPLTSAAMNQLARTGSAAEQSVFGARWPAKNIEQEMAKRAAQYEADAAEKAQQGTATSSEWASEYSRRASAIRTVLADMERRAERENGQLYEVEIPEDSEMLLWDKPLAEAPEGVRDAVYGMGLQGRWMNGASGERVFIAPPTATMSGEQAYARISRLLGSDQAASEALAAAGVKGIKYLDGTSRKDGDGSYNYVIFNGDDVQIERAHFSRTPGDQTQTENFRRWFAGSKVVDAEGKPLVMYHGTNYDFSVFQPNESGLIFLSPSAEEANGFTGSRGGATTNDGVLMPVYVRAIKPFDFEKKAHVDALMEALPYGSNLRRADVERGNWNAIEETHNVLPTIKRLGFDGVYVKENAKNIAVFRPEQIKSAIGNNGNFDPNDPDIRFSRAAVSGMASKALDELNRTFAAPGKLSWWHKTVGTMYNLAERSPVFKRVFDSAQGFVDDVSHYATDAAELAPKLLPKLETWRDIAKRPISAADNAAVAKPVFEGTLDWARDEAGKPVRLQVLLDAAEKLTPEQKAQRLLRNNKISEGMLKAWQGLPLEQYEKLVASRYESQMLKAGIVWTQAELKSQFKLNDAQVALYQEFRAATDRSLDTMARSDMLRFGGEDVKDLADMVMDAASAQDAAQILRDHLLMLAKENPDRAGAIGQLANGMLDRAARVQELQEQGYAPLSRFGKYTVDVVDAGGERQYFGLFETAREANIMALKMRKGFGQDAVTQGTLSDEEFKLLAGITPESLELFGNMLGLDATGDDAQDQAFQEYLRRTKTNRSAMRRLIHRQGIAGYSEDVGRVLASFIYSNARQTSAGLHMGDLGEAITGIPKQQGELKDAAIQLSEYVKNPQEEAQMVRGLLFAQYLGGSIASALVNMTQPVAVSFPWLSQFGGAKQAATELGRAAKNLASRGHRYEADLAAALKLAEEEGTVSPQEVHQLMAQARGSGSLRPGDGTRAGDAWAAAGNARTRLSLAWGKVFGAAEQVNRRMTFIAAYRVAKAQGMANPAAFAKKAVVETQFVYSKANKMKWGRGAVGATVMTFKTYSIAYIELLHRMYTQGGPEGKQAALLALAVLMLMGGAGGLPFAEDAEDLADGLAQMMGYNFNSKKAKQELLESVFGEAGAGFVERGITGLPGMPLDVSGRLGMGNLLPGTGIFKEKTDHTRDVLELVGPVGDLAKRVASGGRSILTGDVGAGLLQVSPVAVRNAAKGTDMAARGMYRDDKGYKVLDTTPTEAAMKAIGFQPASVSKVQEANFINQQAKNFYSMQANEIRAMWARGIFEQNPDLVEDARARVEDWNRKNPDQRMVIAMPAVFKRVREMSKTKDQRIADTAPKAMRQALREESARARAAQ